MTRPPSLWAGGRAIFTGELRRVDLMPYPATCSSPKASERGMSSPLSKTKERPGTRKM